MALRSRKKQMAPLISLCLFVVACAGAVGEDASGAIPPVADVLPPPPTPATEPSQTNEITQKPDEEDAVRFLMAASFGPTEQSVNELIELGYSGWITAQMQLPARSIVDSAWPTLEPFTGWRGEHRIPINEFYKNAILGEDQLRVRAAYSLSQVLVTSGVGNNVIMADGEGVAGYMDILQNGAFGNYRDLLEEITYSPIMGEYLTYAGNRKANPEMGSAPDENYARELMQLFTIGLHELNIDGSVKLDEFGQPIETYTNEDVTELAKVFTGLWWDGLPFGERRNQRTQESSVTRMVMHEDQNSNGDKFVLGEVIAADLNGTEAISAALDILFEHPNTAPFISRLLIQRMTTSNPSPAYVRRVADAFNQGLFEIQGDVSFGSGERGDLTAVWAAILLDREFHAADSKLDATFGKVREPVLRFAHWARFSGVSSFDLVRGRTILDPFVLDHQDSDRLGQRIFTAPSVFNFYRPGYSAPGSATAALDMVAPEMQIADQNSVVAYSNFMRTLIFRDPGEGNTHGTYGLIGDYSEEVQLAHDPAALIDRLDLLLTGNELSDQSRVRIALAVESVPVPDEGSEEALRNRVQLALLLVAVSPEFMVQQ